MHACVCVRTNNMRDRVECRSRTWTDLQIDGRRGETEEEEREKERKRGEEEQYSTSFKFSTKGQST